MELEQLYPTVWVTASNIIKCLFLAMPRSIWSKPQLCLLSLDISHFYNQDDGRYITSDNSTQEYIDELRQFYIRRYQYVINLYVTASEQLGCVQK